MNQRTRIGHRYRMMKLVQKRRMWNRKMMKLGLFLSMTVQNRLMMMLVVLQRRRKDC